MKIPKNHLALYDAECPICATASKSFLKPGMTSGNGLVPYQTGIDTVCPYVDKQKAADEIALVDLETGNVLYGLDSLLKVAGGSYPWIERIGHFKPLHWLMMRMYRMLCYNRYVILPSTKKHTDGACLPALKLQYRIPYLLFTWFLTSFILTRYAHLLSATVPLGHDLREYIVCGGQIVFQALVILFIAKDKLWNYLGNLMAISFGGAILLSLLLLANRCVAIPSPLPLFYFMLTVGLMFLEHIRRSKLLGLGWTMTLTWVLYRIAILALIFYAKF